MSEETSIGDFVAECKQAWLETSNNWSEKDKETINRYAETVIRSYFKHNDFEKAQQESEKYVEAVQLLAGKADARAEVKAEMAKAGIQIEDKKADNGNKIRSIQDIGHSVSNLDSGTLAGYAEIISFFGGRKVADALNRLINTDLMVGKLNPDYSGKAYSKIGELIVRAGDEIGKYAPVNIDQLSELKDKLANSEFAQTAKTHLSEVPKIFENLSLPQNLKDAARELGAKISTVDIANNSANKNTFRKSASIEH